ncbi:hypothetical protein [Hyphococcus sp.]|uniref:hypothetical protein n=1 Tax=Hyphococcus sp. TaxID=2038636 RepID=UPI003CCBDB3D
MSVEPDKKLTEVSEKTFATPFGAVLMLEPEDAAPLWVDGRVQPPAISMKAPQNAKLDCILRGRPESLARALASNRAFESSFVSGRVTAADDMSVLARLELGPKA